jgi:hypothetical protein
MKVDEGALLVEGFRGDLVVVLDAEEIDLLQQPVVVCTAGGAPMPSKLTQAATSLAPPAVLLRVRRTYLVGPTRDRPQGKERE